MSTLYFTSGIANFCFRNDISISKVDRSGSKAPVGPPRSTPPPKCCYAQLCQEMAGISLH